MSSRSAELSAELNARSPKIFAERARKVRIAPVFSTIAPRLALRSYTPYPYKLVEDDTFYTKEGVSFGRIIKASRAEGLHEIHKKIEVMQREHSWLYLPETSEWIDAAVSSTSESVEHDGFLRLLQSHMFSTIENVHTHPDPPIRALAHTKPEGGYSSNYLVEAARPSPSDILIHDGMTIQTPANSQLISSVVSHYGVTSFYSTDPSGESGEFRVDLRAWLIPIPHGDNPIQSINMWLGTVASTVVHSDGTPAVNMDFQPLV